MWIELPGAWIVILNVIAIPAIHLGVSWLFTRLPGSWFRAGSMVFRSRRWEREGRTYERLFGVRLWKDLLPDAAPWFDGFPKQHLMGRDPGYLRAFRTETCRGEAAHYAQIPAIMAVLAWNPWPVAATVIILYAFLSNLPCIIVQRHTRLRLGHLLAALAAKRRDSPPPQGSG